MSRLVAADTFAHDIAILERCRHDLVQIRDLKTVLDVRDKALAIRTYLRAKGEARLSQNSAACIAALAEARAGQLIREGQETGTIRTQGGTQSPTSQLASLSDGNGKPKSLNELGITASDSSRLQLAADVLDKDPDWFEAHRAKCTEEGWDFTQQSVLRHAKELRNGETGRLIPAAPAGVYDVIVIDPPWPTEKIAREQRPNQATFDYPTMSEEELAALALPLAEHCHVWIWTTQRFLPMALRLAPVWQLRYVCTFVWHKSAGMQVAGLPRYNCEFILYCRHGTPVFADLTDFATCNVWQQPARGNHSRKPEAFYELVSRVTHGQRLDMFSRRPIAGFEAWGNEAPSPAGVPSTTGGR